jgi:hypothetical protein
MKVKDLIELLKTIPEEAEVFAWHDGDCHELHEGIDCLDLSSDQSNVQINVKNSHDYQ